MLDRHRRVHRSRTAAYLYAAAVADEWQKGKLPADVQSIVVAADEGLGRGWQVYELLVLADLAR